MVDLCQTYDFCESIINPTNSSIKNSFKFAIEESGNVRKIVDELKATIPYSVNVIKELHVNENANSRILCSLLRYKSDNDGYWILQSLLDYLDIDIKPREPEINVESERIDISVREGDGYAIIFENKIYDAALQKNQIARYIDKMSRYVKKDKIYIILLPSTPSYEFNDCCWVPEPKRDSKEFRICSKCDSSSCELIRNNISQKLDVEFEDRTRIAPFTTCIYPWLKQILKDVPKTEPLLNSAITQYIDYLGDYFLIDEKFNFIHMKTQEFIESKLLLSDKTNSDKIRILSDKIEDIESLLEEMKAMKEKYEEQYAQEMWPEVTDALSNALNRIAEDYGMLPISWNIADVEDEYFWTFKKKSWKLSIMFKKMTNGNIEVAIGLPDYVDCGIQDRSNYLGNRTGAGWPYGYDYLWDECDLPLFIQNIKSGKLEQDIRSKLDSVIDIIKENGISMR